MKQLYQSPDSSKSLPHMTSGRPHLTACWGSVLCFKTHMCLPFYSVRYILIYFTYINKIYQLITTKSWFVSFIELFWIFRYFFTHYVNARVEPSKSMAIGFQRISILHLDESQAYELRSNQSGNLRIVSVMSTIYFTLC